MLKKALCLIPLLTLNCQSIRSHVAANDRTFDFCAASGVHPNAYDPYVWSGAMVQTALTDLINDPTLQHAPEAAYAVSYRRMTQARDEARCHGELVDKDPAMNLLTHQLADIMTRWYIAETRLCLAGKAEVNNGFCGVFTRSKKDNYDAISVAMADTAVYLSSHIAWSLSALAYNDIFWNEFPDPATRHDQRPFKESLAARKRWLLNFKITYDRFNSFLGANLAVVATALAEAGMLRDQSLVVASSLSKLIPCKSSMFSSIRDKSFKVAMEILDEGKPELHPMIRADHARYVLNYTNFEASGDGPTAIKTIEDFSLNALANPVARATYRDILGGKTLKQLTCEI